MLSAKSYFESVRHANERAEALADIAETLSSTAGAAKAMRYDRPTVGRQKNGCANVDTMFQTVDRCESAAARAYDAKERALGLVSEACDLIEKMLEDPSADANAIMIVCDYYINNKTDETIARERFMTQSGVNRARQRGLRKADPWVSRYVA